MAGNKSSRIPLWILALVVLAVAFFIARRPGGVLYARPTPVPSADLSAPPPPPPPPTPTCGPWVAPLGNKKVLVGPGIQTVNPDCLTVKAIGDTITWKTYNTPATLQLWIEFAEKPFVTMGTGTYARYRANCDGDTCNSGTIVTPYPPGTPFCPGSTNTWCKEYKFTQVFHDPSAPSNDQKWDGRIIIQW